MFPDLIDFGFLHLKTYGACMAIGFLLSWKLIERLSPRRDLGNLLVALMIAGVVGARTAYVIENWSVEFANDWAAIIQVWRGGLVFYGGLILAVLTFFVWCRLKRCAILDIANLLSVALPLGHACGRIGCFFYGCCYGRVSSSAWAVAFPVHSPAWCEQVRTGAISSAASASLRVLPTQLFEAAALLVLFAILLAVYRQVRRYSAAIYLVGYGFIRFGLEYLRGDPRAEIGPFSIGQTISFGVVALGGLFFICERIRQKCAHT